MATVTLHRVRTTGRPGSPSSRSRLLVNGEVVKTNTGVSASGYVRAGGRPDQRHGVHLPGDRREPGRAEHPLEASNKVTPETLFPRVTAISLDNGATKSSANLTATFNKSLNPTFVTRSSVQLRNNATGLTVGTVVSYNDATRTITVDPTLPLTADRSYTPTLIGTGTADPGLGGNQADHQGRHLQDCGGCHGTGGDQFHAG